MIHVRFRSPTAIALTALASAFLMGRPATVGAQADSSAYMAVMAAALDDVRNEFQFGRVVFDRVVADTGMRLAPPLMSKREHPHPEDWARRLGIETVATELTTPACNTLRTSCQLQGGIVGVIAFGEPTISGNTANLIARYSETVGVGPTRVRTTVVELTLTQSGDKWKVSNRKVRAVT